MTALAASACRPKATTSRRVKIESHELDPKRGHELRAGTHWSAKIEREAKVPVVIAGAGIAGLSAAWRLDRAGFHDYVLIDPGNEPGGNASGAAFSSSAHPLAAHYLPVPHRENRSVRLLLQELRIEIGEDRSGYPIYLPSHLCAAPIERHHYRGRWFPGLYPDYGQTKDEAQQWQRFDAWLDELALWRGRDGRRIFRLPMGILGPEAAALDRQTIAQLLDEKGFTSWRVRWYVDYACRDDYGLRLDQCSAFAALHRFCCRRAPDRPEDLLITRPEGNAWLARALAKSLKGQLHRRGLVYRIDAHGRNLQTCADLQDTGTSHLRQQWHSEHVIWAAPRFILDHVMRSSVKLPRPSYTPWLVASLELDRAPAGFGAALAWDNVVVDAEHLGYVYANHAAPPTRKDQNAVISYYEPLFATQEGLAEQRAHLLSMTPEQCTSRVVRELERVHPQLRQWLRGVHITRWGHAMLRPEPRWCSDLLPLSRQSPDPRIVACGCDSTGLPLFEEAFYAGIAAAESVLTQLGIAHGSLVD